MPDIGDFKNVPVIEVHVKPGDAVKADDPLDHARERQGGDGSAGACPGKVAEILVKIGDKVSEGSAI